MEFWRLVGIVNCIPDWDYDMFNEEDARRRFEELKGDVTVDGGELWYVNDMGKELLDSFKSV